MVLHKADACILLIDSKHDSINKFAIRDKAHFFELSYCKYLFLSTDMCCSALPENASSILYHLSFSFFFFVSIFLEIKLSWDFILLPAGWHGVLMGTKSFSLPDKKALVINWVVVLSVLQAKSPCSNVRTANCRLSSFISTEKEN